MRKIEIHTFSERTSGSKTFRVTPLRIAVFVICLVLAVVGFVIFSPMRIASNISDGDALSVYRQNRGINREIRKVRESVDETILRAEEIKLLRDSAVKLSGLGFTLDDALYDESVDVSHRKSIREIEKSFKNLLSAIEKNPALAASIPVLHPLKNGHAVRNRFEMIHDPFTEIDLPHRGIDFVAEVGDTVYATGAGVVAVVRSHRGFGLSVKIEHTPGVKTFYAHLGQSLVQPGERVHRGSPIAIINESGRESGVGLHYEIRLNGVPVNPEDYFITK